MQWKLVVEGDSDRAGAKANANVFVDMLRAEGHTVRQALFYGEVGRPADEVSGVGVVMVEAVGAESVAEDVATEEPAPEPAA